jgi:hypothetical protein
MHLQKKLFLVKCHLGREILGVRENTSQLWWHELPKFDFFIVDWKFTPYF